MRYLVLITVLVFNLSCAQKKQVVQGETEWQKEMNAKFKDASTTPFSEKDLKEFKGLEFFKFDSTYVIKARLKRTPDSKPFKMMTTTDRRPDYKQFGIVSFELEGKTHEVAIYQILDLAKKEGYDDYLFLPYLDHTNGETTYSGGRYVDARIPEGNTIEIDFNKSYNPYCVYNKERYSCPIVPIENYIKATIKAGVKAYKK